MKKRYYSICVILWVLITTLSATSPTTFHIALKKDISACHERKLEPTRELLCSLFYSKMVLKKKVWMNGNAQWVMTNTNLQNYRSNWHLMYIMILH